MKVGDDEGPLAVGQADDLANPPLLPPRDTRRRPEVEPPRLNASEAPGVVLVADGRSRGIARPKRKNVKHLEFGGTAPAALVEKLAGGQPVNDEDIRAAISAAAPSVAAE